MHAMQGRVISKPGCQQTFPHPQFEYPDCYKADDPQPCAQDANLLLHEEVEVAASAAGQGADALAHLRSEQGARDA